MMRRLAMLLGLAALGAQAPATAQDGATIYKRCAACHLADGAGVPGAFPPLKADVRALAATAAGRRYLALVVIRGVSGPITVAGKVYRGTMPAQAGLNDTQVAAVLNHVVRGSNAKAFTAKEIAGYRVGGASLSPAAVAKLQPGAAGK
ncbi:Cytochrome C oxidase, cbb3-type, subunit III [Sphingopyxis sp. YR583]|uniref:c-type cytochrome n=1 Tax=Sphingopyxis sp. YR583 TaxID=1881047 RepID=UPI0008A81005|nr:cytochrome c [Sphingopyxis sp. YR583]SEH13897.1 Cytochrome C oxidase, cbb3-type, subunit III [Sphingopyxis sp. YR583]